MYSLPVALTIFMLSIDSVTTRDAYIQPDVNYYMEGDTVTLTCVVTNQIVNIENVNFIFKGRNDTEIDLPFLRKGIRTLQTTIHNVRVEDNGTVFCAYNHRELAKQTFFVQEKPTLPEISCLYDYGIKVLNCSWTGSQTTCWTFQYRRAYGKESDNFTSCEIDGSSLERCTCHDWYCRGIDPSPRFYSAVCHINPFEDKDNLNNFYETFISGRKILSTVSRKWPQYIDSNIVKLPPVVNLTIGFVTPHTADISWSISHYPCTYQMYCKISYHIPGTTRKSSQEITIKCDEQTDTVSSSLSPLYPNTSYIIGVTCQEFGSKFWSDVTSMSLKTKPSAPIDGPELDEGSYKVYTCHSSSKCILLYWKASTNQMNGLVTGYKVNLNGHNGENAISMFGNVITANLTGIYVPSRDYKVSVWSKNDIGYSNMSSGLFIRARNSGLPETFCVKSRKIESTNNIAKFVVSWSTTDGIPRDVTVTYYRCLGYIVDNSVVICKSDFDWVKKSAGSGCTVNVTVPLKILHDEISSWHFGVSLSRNNISTGITWDIASCSINATTKNKRTSVYLVSLIALLVPAIYLGICVMKCIKKFRKNDIQIDLPDMQKKTGSQNNIFPRTFESKIVKDLITGYSYYDVHFNKDSFSNKAFEKNEGSSEDHRQSSELNIGDGNASQDQNQTKIAETKRNEQDISVNAGCNDNIDGSQEMSDDEFQPSIQNEKYCSQLDVILPIIKTPEQETNFEDKDHTFNGTTIEKNQEDCKSQNQIVQTGNIPYLLKIENDDYIMSMDHAPSTMNNYVFSTIVGRETDISAEYIQATLTQDLILRDKSQDRHGRLQT